jgi:hypothetical protein
MLKELFREPLVTENLLLDLSLQTNSVILGSKEILTEKNFEDQIF